MSASLLNLKRVIQASCSSSTFALNPGGGNPITSPDPASVSYKGTRYFPDFAGSLRVGGLPITFERPVIRRIRIDLSMANYARATPGVPLGGAGSFVTSNVLGLKVATPGTPQKLLVNFNRFGEWIELESSSQFTNDKVSSYIEVEYPDVTNYGVQGVGFNIDLRNVQTPYLGTAQEIVVTAEIFCANYTILAGS